MFEAYSKETLREMLAERSKEIKRLKKENASLNRLPRTIDRQRKVIEDLREKLKDCRDSKTRLIIEINEMKRYV